MQVSKAKKGYKLVDIGFGKLEEIPDGWEIVHLEDLFCVGSSKRVLKSEWQTEGIPFYRGREITSLSIYGKVENELFISEDLYEKYVSKYGVPKVDDIMITAIGTIGNSYIVKKNEKFYFKDASVLWLKKISNVNSKFINYWLKSEKFFKQLDRGNGATVDTLTVKKLQSVMPPIPPLSEQKQIVDILSNIDNTLEKTNQLIEKFELLKKGLTNTLVTRGIGNNNFTTIQLKQKYLQLIIPKTWNYLQLGKITEIIDTPHYTSPILEEGIPVIRTSDCMPSGRIDYAKTLFTSQEEYEKRSKIISPDVGDLLFTREAPLGISVLVDKKEIAVGQRIILLKTDNSKIYNPYLMYFFNSEFGKKQIFSFAVSTTVERANILDIKQFQIPIPPLSEQKQIATILSNVDSQINKEKLQKSNLELLKKGLMQKLLTGQIRVIV